MPAKLINYRFEARQSFSNRLLVKLNPRILRINFNLQQKINSLPAGLPASGEAVVLLSTTEPIKLHFAWLLQEKFGYTVIPYFMDDWMAGMDLRWKGGSIQEVVASILQKAPCRLMISRNLDEILVKRYHLSRRPTLVVHNPAPEAVNKIQSEDDRCQITDGRSQTPGIENKSLQIVYAGSIWPMHFDALKALADALHLLHNSGKKNFGLTIYTSEAAWQHNRKALEGPGVVYGGFIPYAEMPGKLAGGWLLLVAASFDERYAPFTNSSVQTKLTDYMAAGKPVLYVGPHTGASGQFVHEWDCGFTIGSSLPADIAAQLEVIAALPQQWQRKAENGLAAASGRFSKTEVQQKLYRFLEQWAMPVKPAAKG